MHRSASSLSLSDDDAALAALMRVFVALSDPQDGVPVKDRRYLFRTFRECFVAREAVQWLVAHGHAADAPAAVALGVALQRRGLLEHVTRDHVFKDENLFFRFLRPLEAAPSWSELVPHGSDDDSVVADNVQAAPAPVADDNMLAAVQQLDIAPLDEHNLRLLDQVRPRGHVDPTPTGVYNMVVIGAGAAGLVTAAGSAGVGAKVAIVEKHLMGGDCLNSGCVPSKALLRAARAVHEARSGGAFGVVIDGSVRCDFGRVMERMRQIRASIAKNDSVARFTSLGVDVFLGAARFSSESTVEVNGKTLQFSKACIATGGRAAVPPIPGLDKVAFLTNDTFFNLTEMPARFAVLGSGAVACEIAQAMVRFGSAVTMLARSAGVLTREDADAAALVGAQLTSDGVDLLLECSVTEVQQAGDRVGPITLKCEVGAAKRQVTLQVDALLVATGRVPNVEGLNLERAGVRYDRRRGVMVNDHLQTSAPNVYAAGDVIGRFQLTHMADAAARIVIRNALFFGTSKLSGLVVPTCLYTAPEVAKTGALESDLRARGIEFATFRVDMSDVDRAVCDSSTAGFVKVLVAAGSDRILGATIVADHAGELISEVTAAIVTGTGLAALANVIHPYPTQADAIRQCANAFQRGKLTTAVRVLFRNLLAARR